ncbi:hypothetical protein C8R46DRAFT_1361156 [Mycena filopes]|nr:hypothetical protein C8R46DRAFT_1138408 [Mycena filopes]KAJ7141556.1 hypothetical protein C8R46DRAFT_1361156 [Mycena filopes]
MALLKAASVFRPLPFPAARCISSAAASTAPVVRRRRPALPRISSLSPSSIMPTDCLDVSGRDLISIQFLNAASIKVQPRVKFGYGLPFPAGCTGFLYYHRDTNAAPLEGGLRFRLGSTDNSFPSVGADLMMPNGLPWQVTLLQLSHPGYGRVADQLLREHLITPVQLSRCREMVNGQTITPALTLFRPTQEFPVDFTEMTSTFAVVGTESLRRFRKTGIFHFRVSIAGKRVLRNTLSGSALARFEKARLEDGRPVARMRITKIVHPIVPVAIREYPPRQKHLVDPKEGELLQMCGVNGEPEPWVYDLGYKGKFAAGLRVLFGMARI